MHDAEKPEFLLELYRLLYRWKHISFEEFDDGAILIGHVPKIGSHAYLHNLLPRANVNKYNEMISNLNITEDDELARFLRFHNGGYLFRSKYGCRINIYGSAGSFVRSDFASMLKRPWDIIELGRSYHKATLEKGGVPFATGYGEYLYILCSDGAVHSAPKSNPQEVLREWRSFSEWLLCYTEECSKFFNDDGIWVYEEA